MSFRLYTLGGLRLEGPDGPITGPAAQRRRLALLALLAASDRPVTRDKALGLLWPELAEARARHQLSESLYVLRRALGDTAVTAAQDDLRLDPLLVSSDVADLRAVLAAGQHEKASALYRGPFLEGFYLAEASEFEQWVAGERDRIARAYVSALERGAEQLAAKGDAMAAAERWRELVTHDPFSSRLALRYMQALATAGDRARAVQYARTYTTRLREELGLEADAEIAKLAEQLQRTGEEQRPAAAAQVAANKPVASSVEADIAELAPEFEVVRVLGEGTVGRVFLAKEPALRRLVAIKMLLPVHASVSTMRKRFEREAQSAARIQHPNVVTAFRFGRLRGSTPYIVMPYIAGGSLEDRLAATGPMSIPDATRHLRQLAGGLAAAHRLGIVHRDVRTANLLYDRDADRVMLTDFGLAAVLDSAGEPHLQLTRPGERLGNFAYASPEQLRGEPVSERADVYSLAVVAFEMITGRLPYAGANPVEVMIAAATTEPLRLRDVLPDANEKLDALLRRCLNPRPEQRPFAEEVASALER